MVPVPTLYDRARQALTWGTAELVARQAIQFAALLGLALILQPGDFGLMAMVLAFTAFGVLFSDFGLGMALVQRQHTSAGEESAVLVLNLFIAAALALALLLVAPVIARFYDEPRVLGLAQLMALTFPLAALATVPDALLTKRLQFQARARVELLASGSGALAAFMLAWQGFGAWSLAWQVVVTAAVRALALWLHSGWLPSRPDFRGVGALVRFGAYMLSANLVDTVYTRLQALLIGRLAGPRDAGLYTMAQNVPQAPAAFIGALMHRLGMPLMSAIQSDPARCAAAFRRVLTITLFAFAPAMVGLAMLAEPLVSVVLGDDWNGTADLLVPLTLAAIPWPWHVLNLVTLNAMGRSDLVLRIELPKKAVAISLLLLASPFGSEAIAWSVLAASVLAVPFNTRHVGRIIGLGLGPQLAILRPTLLLFVFSGIASAATRLQMAGHDYAQVVSTVVMVATYAAGAILIRHPALAEIGRVLSSAGSEPLARKD